MATILEKLNEIDEAKKAIQAAVRSKGGIVRDDTLGSLPDAIEALPQDGYDWGSIGWSEPPSDWSQMVADARVLKEAWEALSPETRVLKTFFKGNDNIQMLPMLEEFNTTADMGNAFDLCTHLQYVPKEATFASATKAGAMFASCQRLREEPTINSTTIVDANNIFYNCLKLRSVTKLYIPMNSNGQNLFSQCQSLEYIGSDCKYITSFVKQINGIHFNNYALRRVDAVNDFSNVTTIGTPFSACNNLQYIRLDGLGNSGTWASLDMHWCPLTLEGVTALFDSLGTPTSTKTLQLAKSVQELLTDELIAMVTEKNWTLTFA